MVLKSRINNRVQNLFSAKLLRYKIKGSALYIAIMVSILIGIILSLFILIANHNQRNIVLFTQSEQLYCNLQSSLQLVQSRYFTEDKNNAWLKNITNDDSIRIKKTWWGAYLMIRAETKNRHQRLIQSGLYGTYMSADTGLMVSDNSRPVGLSGVIVFKSNCYLPKAGIKPAYIEGQSYLSNSQNIGFVKHSPAGLPAINSKLVEGLRRQQNGSDLFSDSLVNYLPKNFKRSFSQTSVAWETSLSRFSNVNLENNIKLIGKEIEIDSSCHFNNVLLICKKIRFKSGFKGKIHVIASDSIILEKKCEFLYPSSFVLLSEDNSKDLRYIQFNEDCKFTGGIIALRQNQNGGSVLVKLHARSEINGFIYSSDYLHTEGIINATAICDKLLLKTPSAVYENHILSCEINPKKYSDVLAIPLVFQINQKLFRCGNVN
jgi:hypothetical protein